MRSPRRAGAWTLVGVALLAPGSAAASADDAELAQQDRIQELERKVEVLTDELARLRTEVAVPEEPEDGLEGFAGLGPAASRIYGVGRGLSLGGYAEGHYRNFVSDEGSSDFDRTDLLRMVLYAGYKFSDRLVFNSEIEFEHGTTESPQNDDSDGSVSVEFAALDYLWKDWLNFRGGMVLAPVGFVNEVHEPPFFHGVLRPQVETQIIPTTWRENGLGVYGRLGETLEYRAYVLSALDALGIGSSNLRGTRQKGNRSRSEDLAGVLRLDWTPLDGLLLGGSVYSGDVDQDRPGYPDSNLTLWELHGQYRAWGLELRGLLTMAHLDEAGDLTRALRADRNASIFGKSDTIAEEWLGWYLEVAYDLMPWLAPDSGWYLAPFFRFEYYDTQHEVPSGPDFSRDRTKEVRLFNPGLTFKPHPNVALKLDYRNFAPRRGDGADEVLLGFGVAF